MTDTIDHTNIQRVAMAAAVPGGASRGRRGAIYTRFSTKYQHSTDDQVRKCREWAEQHGIDIRPEHVFKDEGISGRSSRRSGLKGMLQALRQDQVDVIIALATSRLYRKSYRAAQFVEEEIIDRGKRAIFIDTNIDTADEGRWRQYFQIQSMMDEFTATSTIGHIRASLEGLFLQGRVFGSLAFGYTGRDIPGQRTRKGTTARQIVIDPAAADWVKKAFHWFVQDRQTMYDIAQRLMTEGAPPPPHTSDGRWSQAAVRRLLGNECYTGRWTYGKTKNTWNNAKSYTHQVRRDKPLKEMYFEDLRILDDATWHRAQELLAANMHYIAGRKPRDTNTPRPKLLNGLLYCHLHDRALIVGASYGASMYCPLCKKGPERVLYSLLNRQTAVSCLCRSVAALIRQDTDLVEQVVAACQRHIEVAGQPDPAQMDALKRKETTLSKKIDFIFDSLGDTDADRLESKRKLQDLRAQRSAIQVEIAELQAAADRPTQVPSERDVRQLIDQMADVLLQAIESQDPAEWGAARRVLEDITGGKIIVTQQGETKAKRGWLRGTFRVHLIKLLAGQAGCNYQGDGGIEVTVDFRDLPPYALIADQAKALYDQSILIKDIAVRLGVTRNLVTKALKYWFGSRNLPVPDSRDRRYHIEHGGPEAHKFQQMAQEALRLRQSGLKVYEVASQLGCDRNTASRAIRHARQADHGSSALEPVSKPDAA